MKSKILLILVVTSILFSFKEIRLHISTGSEGRFDVERDLLLVQFDCKTDVDDLHTAAGLVTLLSYPEYSKVNFHAVAGTYGIQDGLYVPPNELFQLAFKNNWTDAHKEFSKAVKKVEREVKKTLKRGGDIWIAEAGQSDFSAAVIGAIQSDMPEMDCKSRIHIVQHSDWNEEVTSPDKLKYVQQTADYRKIPDGNAEGNGTPGFRSPGYTDWQTKIKDPQLLDIWKLAVGLGTTYNGKEGRYNNEAVASGGVDFSDLSEVCFILNIEDIKDTAEFFDRFGG